jgi:uncharacterized protein
VKNGVKVKGFYEAAARGEMNVLFEALAPKIEWREAENSPFAHGNPYVGPEAVGKLLASIGEEILGLAIVPMNVIDGGYSVVVEGRYKGKIRETGNVMDAQFAHVWQFREGKVVRFQQYTDTTQWRALNA